MNSDWAVERRTVCIDCKLVIGTDDNRSIAENHLGHLIIMPYTLVPNQSKYGAEDRFPFKH